MHLILKRIQFILMAALLCFKEIEGIPGKEVLKLAECLKDYIYNCKQKSEIFKNDGKYEIAFGIEMFMDACIKRVVF